MDDPFRRVWRTVVFAGAMLATPGIASADQPSPGPTAPAGNEQVIEPPSDKVVVKKPKKKKHKKRRVRGNPCGDKGPVGRGFILS